jgi:hypothetical protein
MRILLELSLVKGVDVNEAPLDQILYSTFGYEYCTRIPVVINFYVLLRMVDIHIGIVVHDEVYTYILRHVRLATAVQYSTVHRRRSHTRR